MLAVVVTVTAGLPARAAEPPPSAPPEEPAPSNEEEWGDDTGVKRKLSLMPGSLRLSF